MKKCILSLSVLTLLAGPVRAEIECYTSAEGIIDCSTRDGEGRLVKASRLVLDASCKKMYFWPSPTGMLMYLTKTPFYTESQWEAHSEWGPDKEARRPQEYIPDAVPLVLHVCDPQGRIAYELPVEQRYGEDYNHGRFYGEHFVGLAFKDRFEGVDKEILVDLKRSRMWTIGKEWDSDIRHSTVVSPDGNHLLNVHGDMFYLNGNLIYPYYDEDPYCLSVSPEAYRDKWEESRRRKAELEWDTGERGHYDMYWSPNSRYLLLAVVRTDTLRQQADWDANLCHHMIIDIEKVNSGGALNEYSRVVTCTVGEKPPEAYVSYSAWSEDGQSIEVRWRNYSWSDVPSLDPERDRTPIGHILEAWE